MEGLYQNKCSYAETSFRVAKEKEKKTETLEAQYRAMLSLVFKTRRIPFLVPVIQRTLSLETRRPPQKKLFFFFAHETWFNLT